MIPTSDVRALFVQNGLDGPVPAGLTLKKIIPESPFGPLKLRVYPDESTAIERLKYLDVCREAGIRVPAVLAHEDRYVIFDFLPAEKAGPDTDSLRDVGRFLGKLNTIPTEPVDPEVFFSEVQGWLENLGRTRLLDKRLLQPILNHLRGSLPAGIRTGIDYWDAMPHNFGRCGDAFHLLDEKHTRHSFCGVGLVKPMLVFPEQGWAAVREGYAEIADLGEFDRHRPFLTYYYLLAALYFYSLITAAGRIDPATNSRLHRYRRMLLKRTSDLPPGARLRADLRFVLARPRSLPHLLRPRFSDPNPIRAD